MKVIDHKLGKVAPTRPKADRDNLHHLGATMPGMVVEVKVKPGDEVGEGDKLIVIEAMKMELTVASPLHGVVKEIHVKPKERVDSGDLLIVFQ